MSRRGPKERSCSPDWTLPQGRRRKAKTSRGRTLSRPPLGRGNPHALEQVAERDSTLHGSRNRAPDPERRGKRETSVDDPSPTQPAGA